MKKNIGLIKMDSILEKWLLEKLIKDSPQTESGQELLSDIHEMITGEVTSLLLSKTGETEVKLDVLTAGELEVHPKSRRVVMQGKDISLTPKEFDILYFLIQNKGEVFTKEQIYKAVWSDNYLLDDSNIMAFIRKLRKKIEPNPDEPKYILTIWGIGYKFNDSLK
ncbi:winged helix family transcriptional regulator [Catenibacterium mitsuokai]|uniref:winged helix-turn-helix domain-containing protein n=1 Tax=Catenibacterium mitsuokai TaxID=100886 RepID=UPI0030B93600|nr:winged helix family transcriptional regulator [Catenibacterium mitsuokai]